MKRFLIIIALATLSINCYATDRFGNPVYNQNSQNFAYQQGKSNNNNDVAKALIITGLIIIGVTAIKASVNNNGQFQIAQF